MHREKRRLYEPRNEGDTHARGGYHDRSRRLYGGWLGLVHGDGWRRLTRQSRCRGRPGARDVRIATAMLPPGSLQLMTRRCGHWRKAWHEDAR